MRSSQRINELSSSNLKCTPSIRDAAREKPKGVSIRNGCSYDMKYRVSPNKSGNTPIHDKMSCLEMEHDYEWYERNLCDDRTNAMKVFNSNTVIIETELPSYLSHLNEYANNGLIDITRENCLAQKSAKEEEDSSSSGTNFADLVPLSDRHTVIASQLCTHSSDVMEHENSKVRNQIYFEPLITSFDELSMTQTDYQQQYDLLNVNSFRSEDLDGVGMVLCGSSSKSIEVCRTDEVCLHNELCKTMDSSIDNLFCNGESSINTSCIFGSTSIAEEPPDISQLLTMSSLEFESDVVDIAKNPYLLDNIRICICDQKYSSHRKCKACSELHGWCDLHRTVQCNGCASFFHLHCVGWMESNDEEDVIVSKWNDKLKCTTKSKPFSTYKEWKCSKCWAEYKKSKFLNHSFQDLSIYDICVRIGIGKLSHETERTLRKNTLQAIQLLQTLVPQSVYNDLMLMKPRQYPTLVPMDKNAVKKHIFYGRRFETSMFYFEAKRCTCCGRVLLNHCDPFYKRHCRHEPLTRRHLCNPWYPAWQCNCSSVCKGSQFYSVSKRKQIEWYKHHHGSEPWVFLGIPKSEPNAQLCKHCHHEDTSKIGMYTSVTMNMMTMFTLMLYAIQHLCRASSSKFITIFSLCFQCFLLLFHQIFNLVEDFREEMVLVLFLLTLLKVLVLKKGKLQNSIRY